MCNDSCPCRYWEVTKQDTKAKFKKSDRMRIFFVPRFKLMSRMWSISPWGSQTLSRLPEGKVEGRKAKGGLQVPLRFQVTGILWICLRQGATRASVPPNALENSLTPRSVVLHLPIVASQARPRTETPLREAAENLGCQDSAIIKNAVISVIPKQNYVKKLL